MAVASKSNSANRDAISELRALLGQVRSKGFKVDDRRRAFTYRTGLQRVLLKARTTSKTSPDAFFESLESLTHTDAVRVGGQPVGPDFLFQLLKADPLPLEQEIRWITARITYERAAVSEFVEFERRIESEFVAGSYGKALSLLQQCDEGLGISLWSTELRMGMTQVALGHDAQKKVLKEIRAIRRKGMWPYVANSASLRAENSVSITWFLDETSRRLDRQKKNDFTDYMRFRGLGGWPESGSACARILRTEQSHHIIDLYETFISYLQEAATRHLPSQVRAAIKESIAQLAPIDDPRLDKLSYAFGGKHSKKLPTTDGIRLISALLAPGHHADSMRSVFREIANGAATPERIFSLALATQRTSLANPDHSSDFAVAVRGLAEALDRKGYQSLPGARADEKLRKLVHIFGNLPLCRSLRSLVDLASTPHAENSIKNLKLAALNSPEWGFLDLIGFANDPGLDDIRGLFFNSLATEFSDVLSGASSQPGAFRQGIHSLARGTHLYMNSRSDEAIEAIEDALNSNDRVISAQAANVALNAHSRTGDVVAASNLVAREHVTHGVDPDAMPVRQIYQNMEWRDLKEAALSPELSIALSLIQSTEGDDKLRTYRRFALETLLGKFKVRKPGELRDIDTGWPPNLLIFFLSKVCTAAMLDMLPAIRSTREVLEERREICGYLASIDRDGAERHTQEVLEISRELTVLDGMQTIDGSRVHVDVESLSRRLKVDLAESFQRYAALVKTSDETIEGLSKLLKDVSTIDQHVPDYLLAMPVSEPDELLVSMIVRSRERFLFDVPHGLDSYLSKRIRHGSIVGVLRAPAEREGVLAKRNLNGSYRSSGMWADQLEEGSQRAALTAAIIGTSKAIDEHLLRIKDKLLHVRSESKPLGMLEAPLTTPAYLIIRSFAIADASLDSFVDTMFKSLWAMLGQSLANAQLHLKRDSVAFISEQFQSLRVKGSRILKNPEERAAFDAAAARASVGVQAALVTAASWFEPAEPVARTYTLEEVVAIALESVRATTTKFSPDIELSTESTFSFSDFSLPLVCDVFYIALGNVAAHAAENGDPKVWIAVIGTDDNQFLTFTIENEVALSELEHRLLSEKLDEVRKDIALSQGSDRARSEGGSGLHKLASIVSSVAGDSLSFECSRDRFKLQLKIGYSEARPL